MNNLDELYENGMLRKQLFCEAGSMAEYALKRGKVVPSATIKIIESFVIKQDSSSQAETNNAKTAIREDLDITDLVQAHDDLTKIVEPATPQAILMLQTEQRRKGFLSALGPIPLVQNMMGVAILFLLIFILVVMSPDVIRNGANIFNSSGDKLLVNLLFLLSASGIGASFSALYKANRYITNLTFDPNHEISYWIRFLLGLISGLILSLVISDKAINSDFLEEGIVRPLLAILGGFSADLVYTFLNRMVETVKSLFQGSTEEMVKSQAQEAKSKLSMDAVANNTKLAMALMKARQEMGVGAKPEEMQATLDKLLEQVIPGVNVGGGGKT